jgi:hypothetical protein
MAENNALVGDVVPKPCNRRNPWAHNLLYDFDIHSPAGLGSFSSMQNSL